jgi:hypothetical protein
MRVSRPRSVAYALVLTALLACDERPAPFEASAQQGVRSIGLRGGVALVDNGARRVLWLNVSAERELARINTPIGKNVVAAAASRDGAQLFVVCAGDFPQKKAEDEAPALYILGPDGRVQRVELPTALSGLAVDPSGRWLALYPAGGNATFVENPNQVVLVDLRDARGPTPYYRSLRSFGGRPKSLTFSPRLGLPKGPSNVLVIESEQDVTLLDLEHVADATPRPEITVRLTNGTSARALSPAGVVFDDGDPAVATDAKIGVRIANDNNIVVLTLADKPEGDPNPNDFIPRINLADVGGVATSLSFVKTEAGVRALALVPTLRKAALVDPDTSVTTDVALPDAYSASSLVTGDITPAAPGADVVLLYGGSSSVGFMSLGRALNTPYRSVEAVNVPGGAREVLSVPAPNQRLKVLVSPNAGFFVLDLAAKTASPLTSARATAVHVSPQGQHLWAFARGGTNLAHVPFGSLAPRTLPLDRNIAALFEVTAADGKNVLVALDTRGTYGATLFDAAAPSLETSRSYSALLMEDL